MERTWDDVLNAIGKIAKSGMKPGYEEFCMEVDRFAADRKSRERLSCLPEVCRKCEFSSALQSE
ncbi:MAG: hypothetical protein LUF27_09190 [Lachnospiraceae bacterium]|nr:hypothetical protein [Lachnospiraceae bacterium]